MTNKAGTTRVVQSEGFVAPRPVYKPTSNSALQEVYTPKPREDSPSPSVVQRLRTAGSPDLALLLANAQAAAKEAPRMVRRPGKGKQQLPTPTPTVSGPPQFQASDILSDEEFIKRTRSISIHTPEARSLFLANGGRDMPGFTHAQTWDMLRQQKLRDLRAKSK